MEVKIYAAVYSTAKFGLHVGAPDPGTVIVVAYSLVPITFGVDLTKTINPELAG